MAMTRFGGSCVVAERGYPETKKMVGQCIGRENLKNRAILVRKMTSALEILSLKKSQPASRMERREVRARDTDGGFVWRVM